jgi:hypothetical protein
MHACLVASGQMLSPSRPLTLHLPAQPRGKQAETFAFVALIPRLRSTFLNRVRRPHLKTRPFR